MIGKRCLKPVAKSYSPSLANALSFFRQFKLRIGPQPGLFQPPSVLADGKSAAARSRFSASAVATALSGVRLVAIGPAIALNPPTEPLNKLKIV